MFKLDNKSFLSKDKKDVSPKIWSLTALCQAHCQTGLKESINEIVFTKRLPFNINYSKIIWKYFSIILERSAIHSHRSPKHFGNHFHKTSNLSQTARPQIHIL